MFDKLKLNEACKEQHAAVLKKGFEPQHVAINLMLIVSELGEACEADRKNHHANVESFEHLLHILQNSKTVEREAKQREYMSLFEEYIKDSFEDEIADAFLRLMDLCGELDIDIEKYIRMKAEYNKTRDTKHGKAY